MKKFLILILIGIFLFSCEQLEKGLKQQNIVTQTEAINGLKEALTVGTKNAVNYLNQPGALYNNPSLRIPFPNEVSYVADKLNQIGLNSLVDKFVQTLNEAAEKSMDKALPIFTQAIQEMTITDAKNILKGGNNAATQYFQSKTYQSLYQAFMPIIKQTLIQVNATKYWSEITTKYNSLPGVKPVNTDLADYVTEQAINRLFNKIAEEEAKIRTDVNARTSDLLKKVFDSNAIII